MTIVNQYPVMEVVMSPWLFVSLSCFACLSLFIAFLAAQERLWGLVISLTAFALVCGGLCAYGLSAKAESGRNRYECLIDDTTPFIEVVEDYEIVGQRGDLWVLEDKVDD